MKTYIAIALVLAGCTVYAPVREYHFFLDR
jgi:hypothetical protein